MLPVIARRIENLLDPILGASSNKNGENAETAKTGEDDSSPSPSGNHFSKTACFLQGEKGPQVCLPLTLHPTLSPKEEERGDADSSASRFYPHPTFSPASGGRERVRGKSWLSFAWREGKSGVDSFN
jgi:hypothetical protein